LVLFAGKDFIFLSSMISSESLNGRDLGPELVFAASRSSGPGGQHVNKVSTKVELRFDVVNSNLLKPAEKALILEKLAKKITLDGILIIVSQSERSQLRNKEKALGKFYLLIGKALTPKKKRKATRPSASSIEKRLEKKRLTSGKKILRRDIEEDH